MPLRTQEIPVAIEGNASDSEFPMAAGHLVCLAPAGELPEGFAKGQFQGIGRGSISKHSMVEQHSPKWIAQSWHGPSRLIIKTPL